MMTTTTAPAPAPAPTDPHIVDLSGLAFEVTTQPQRLTAADRCDTCRGAAYHAVTVYGVEMLFCNHHAKKYSAKLTQIATAWHNESGRLFEEQTRVGISA